MVTLREKLTTIKKLMERFEGLSEEVKAKKRDEYNMIINGIIEKINKITGLTGENKITLEKFIKLIKRINVKRRPTVRAAGRKAKTTNKLASYTNDQGKTFDLQGIEKIESDMFSDYENVVEKIKMDEVVKEVCKGVFDKCEKLQKIIASNKEQCELIYKSFTEKGKIFNGTIKIYYENTRFYYYEVYRMLTYFGNDIECPNNLSDYVGISLYCTGTLYIADGAFEGCGDILKTITTRTEEQANLVKSKLPDELREKVACYNHEPEKYMVFKGEKVSKLKKIHKWSIYPYFVINEKSIEDIVERSTNIEEIKNLNKLLKDINSVCEEIDMNKLDDDKKREILEKQSEGISNIDLVLLERIYAYVVEKEEVMIHNPKQLEQFLNRLVDLNVIDEGKRKEVENKVTCRFWIFEEDKGKHIAEAYKLQVTGQDKVCYFVTSEAIEETLKKCDKDKFDKIAKVIVDKKFDDVVEVKADELDTEVPSLLSKTNDRKYLAIANILRTVRNCEKMIDKNPENFDKVKNSLESLKMNPAIKMEKSEILKMLFRLGIISGKDQQVKCKKQVLGEFCYSLKSEGKIDADKAGCIVLEEENEYLVYNNPDNVLTKENVERIDSILKTNGKKEGLKELESFDLNSIKSDKIDMQGYKEKKFYKEITNEEIVKAFKIVKQHNGSSKASLTIGSVVKSMFEEKAKNIIETLKLCGIIEEKLATSILKELSDEANQKLGSKISNKAGDDNIRNNIDKLRELTGVDQN